MGGRAERLAYAKVQRREKACVFSKKLEFQGQVSSPKCPQQFPKIPISRTESQKACILPRLVSGSRVCEASDLLL